MMKHKTIKTFVIFFLLCISSVSQAGAVLVSKKHLIRQAEEAAFLPAWLLVLIVALVVLFTVLLILSPIGSNKRRGRRRTILR